MNYLTVFLVGIIGGLSLYIFLYSYFTKRESKEGPLATKEDIKKIMKGMEDINNIYKDSYDVIKAEKEFFDNGGD